MSGDAGQVVIEITRDEFTALLLVLGYAAGAAIGEGDQRMFSRAMNTANAVNRNNPRWTPYEVDKE